MIREKMYYMVKRAIPQRMLLAMRRADIKRKLAFSSAYWPINPHSSVPPKGWAGWPNGAKFALILTHDVESTVGLDRCLELAALEERYGFRSAFNFVPGDYTVPECLRKELTARGFEVGIHGMKHKDNLFRSERIFREQSVKINQYLHDWGCDGFRAPAMFHDLEMISRLDIAYDSSTFDTDPFEPQPDGMGTIFPFFVPGRIGGNGFVELPYTLPQDFLLFILLQEKSIGIWQKKADWIVDHGGMALVNTHPDYMCFGGSPLAKQYPVRFYEELLTFFAAKYNGQFWHVLPKELARFWRRNYSKDQQAQRQRLRICMPAYTFYEYDNRVMRYAEALVERGDQVTVLALGQKGLPKEESIRGVNVFHIQNRNYNEKSKFSYLVKLLAFLVRSLFYITVKQLKDPYDIIHVHSVPDFEVFSTVFAKLNGAKVILDIHDIVPEFYASKFRGGRNSFLFKALAFIERLSCRYADHVIISNHLWHQVLINRSVKKDKCTVILNYPDSAIFYPRPKTRTSDRFIMIYPGTLAHHQGLDIAFKALKIIKDLVPKADICVYGMGPAKEGLARIIDNLEMKDRIFLYDSIPIAEMASVMSNTDLGIVPKRNDPFGGDAFSTKILEFMSLGIPVIAAATRIDRYYFDDSIIKFFKPGDTEDLARVMHEMITNDRERADKARNALAFVEDFRWEKKRQDYFGLIEALVSRDKR